MAFVPQTWLARTGLNARGGPKNRGNGAMLITAMLITAMLITAILITAILMLEPALNEVELQKKGHES
jgi:hypothetical protein